MADYFYCYTCGSTFKTAGEAEEHMNSSKDHYVSPKSHGSPTFDSEMWKGQCFDCSCRLHFPTVKELWEHCDERHKVEDPRNHVILAPHPVGTQHKTASE
jgi:hypothetical protein